ncbi:MAG: stalk domain-containing protein [Clostridia bacterium]|nr:stalk domain-containing protein [Clostridia bacterium]
MIRNIINMFMIFILLSLIPQAVYAEASSQTTRVMLNSIKINDSLSPKIINGVVFVPVRPAFEALKWQVEWNNADKSITITNTDKSILLKAGSSEAYLNGEYILLDGPIVLINGRAFAPSKFVAEQLGVKVRWNTRDNLLILANIDSSSVTVNGSRNIVIAGNGIIVNIFEPYSTDTVYDMLNYADMILCSNKPLVALERYKKILDNISKEENPDTYAHIMNNMGNAYSTLAEIRDMYSNILNAIDKYKQALSIYEESFDTINCAIISNNIGNAYRTLWEVSHDNSNLLKALALYTKALNLYPHEGYALDHALIYYNTGITYKALGENSLASENLLKAQNIYEIALKTSSNESEFGVIGYNLANVYKALSELSEKKKYLEKSRTAFEELLKIRPLETYPIDYARIHKCLGDIYKGFFEVDSNEENLTKAVEEFEECLKFYTFENYPIDYAKSQYMMGNVYMLMSDRYNISNAVNAYQEALKVFNASDFPAYNKLAFNGLEAAKTAAPLYPSEN